MTSNSKISGSGIRALAIFKALSQKPSSIDELLSIIEDLDNQVYTKELVLKYINTLRTIGFGLIKIKDKYHLQNCINTIDLSEQNLSLLKYIQKYANEIEHIGLKNNLYEAIQLIEKGMSAKTKELIKNKNIACYEPESAIKFNHSKLKLFEKYCIEKLKLEITYKESEHKPEILYKITPIEVMYNKNNAVFIGYDYEKNLHKKFLIQNITSSKQLPQVSKNNMPSNMTFKLKNRLAKSYMLRPNEVVIEQGENYIIVSSRNEDRNILIKRLLRYNTECEVLYPKECRTLVVDMINEMEKIYV